MDGIKEKYLREKIGDEKTDALKTRIDSMTKELAADGVEMAFKDVAAIFDTSATEAAPAAGGGTQAPAPAAADPSATPPAAATKDEPKVEGVDALVAALKEANAPIADAITKIEATINQHGEQLTALAAKDDAKIAAAFAPKAGNPETPAVQASIVNHDGKAENELDGDLAAILKGQKEDDAITKSPVAPYLQQFAGHRVPVSQ